jgi:hypothetical protein
MEQSLGMFGDRIPTGVRSVTLGYKDVPAPHPELMRLPSRHGGRCGLIGGPYRSASLPKAHAPSNRGGVGIAAKVNERAPGRRQLYVVGMFGSPGHRRDAECDSSSRTRRRRRHSVRGSGMNIARPSRSGVAFREIGGAGAPAGSRERLLAMVRAFRWLAISRGKAVHSGRPKRPAAASVKQRAAARKRA